MLLHGSTLFIDGGTKSPHMQILNHPKSQFVSQNLRHVLQPDMNKILFVMTPGSRSLICHLSSPTSTFKKVQGTKRHLNCSPSKYKGRHDFSSQRTDQSTPLLSRTQRKKKRRGIYSGQILIYTRIATRSHLIRTARNR